ncbi:condensation domain-containing protein, partial [Salmonella enterica]|uniref:condensation domain-containing protein n=1 Tax=Salmonella enterica TaxID=28901 RepID=UPI0022B7391C
MRLDASLGEAIRQTAQAHQATPFMLLLAAFQSLLYRYSGQRDIRIGVPNANRTRHETQGLIGFFINTLVMRAEV